MNAGILNKKTCACTCLDNFTGSRCKMSTDPCNEEDKLECHSINCWNTSEFKFFGCQKRCLCCGNKKCDNGKILKEDCTCQDKFADCKDSDGCGEQFTKEACDYNEIKEICPKMCGICK